MITLLLIIPLIGCLCLIPIKETDNRDASIIGVGDNKIEDSIVTNLDGLQYVSETVDQNKQSKKLMKQIALFASLINLFISIIL
jgi:hypothetical protein